MKLAKIHKLFKTRKSPSVSRSDTDPPSFSSQATSSSSSSSEDVFKKPIGSTTPNSVLPSDLHLDLKQAFQMIDRDGDGKIEKGELERLLRRIGAEPPSQEELKLMLNEVDSDGDGCISLDEFYAISSPACDGEMRETFDFFDSDRDGRITAEELLEVFKTIGDAGCTLEECRRMIRGVDRNGDGFVCFQDFTRMMDVQQV
ncbi:probable calcium-binding protein CML35 [Salvia hispanica]|uniref:probable calcium-binding protein CML35 n=1 Tax=Salvia hispanica TaxID=49212 RepID=UPI002009366B|nr:probable calcium-binding protein CML35 [Salvia hispanica]